MVAGYGIPLYRNPLFRRTAAGPAGCPVSCPFHARAMDYTTVRCPNAETVCEQAVWITQSVLLGAPEDMRDIAGAIEKVWDQRSEVGRT